MHSTAGGQGKVRKRQRWSGWERVRSSLYLVFCFFVNSSLALHTFFLSFFLFLFFLSFSFFLSLSFFFLFSFFFFFFSFSFFLSSSFFFLSYSFFFLLSFFLSFFLLSFFSFFFFLSFVLIHFSFWLIRGSMTSHAGTFLYLGHAVYRSSSSAEATALFNPKTM